MANNTTTFLIICTVLVLYIFINLILQVARTWSRNNEIENAKQKMLDADLAKKTAKENLLKELSNHFDADITKKVTVGDIWDGMPDFLLTIALGKAFEIKKANVDGIATEQWYYGRYKTKLGNIKYRQEVTLEDKIVVDWRDLY